jgi:uncharacterized protein YodC (DUF2158 family)
MAGEFKSGDLVILKSGGPNMTVSRFEVIEGVQYAVCTWFDAKGKKEVGTFAVTTLRHAGI